MAQVSFEPGTRDLSIPCPTLYRCVTLAGQVTLWVSECKSNENSKMTDLRTIISLESKENAVQSNPVITNPARTNPGYNEGVEISRFPVLRFPGVRYNATTNPATNPTEKNVLWAESDTQDRQTRLLINL